MEMKNICLLGNWKGKTVKCYVVWVKISNLSITCRLKSTATVLRQPGGVKML